MTAYCFYEIYECPDTTTEKGKYIGASPILEQVISATDRHNAEVKHNAASGKLWFVKAVRNNGERVTLL